MGPVLAGRFRCTELLKSRHGLSRSDAATYVAKARGKARYEVFEPSMRVAALDRVIDRFLAADPSALPETLEAGTLGVLDKTVGLDTLMGRLVEVLETASTRPAA